MTVLISTWIKSIQIEKQWKEFMKLGVEFKFSK